MGFRYFLFSFFCLFNWTIIQSLADDVGNANFYVDEVLENFRNEPSIHKKLDPLNLPNVEEEKFQIKNFEVKGLGSLYRHGDCTLAYDGKVVNVSAELAVKAVTIDLKYRAKAVFFWLNGHATVDVQTLAVKMDLNGKNGKATLDSFRVIHLGDYKVRKITGMSVVLNWLLKLIANAVAKKSKVKIIDAMENGVATAVNGLLEEHTLPIG